MLGDCFCAYEPEESVAGYRQRFTAEVELCAFVGSVVKEGSLVVANSGSEILLWSAMEAKNRPYLVQKGILGACLALKAASEKLVSTENTLAKECLINTAQTIAKCLTNINPSLVD